MSLGGSGVSIGGVRILKEGTVSICRIVSFFCCYQFHDDDGHLEVHQHRTKWSNRKKGPQTVGFCLGDFGLGMTFPTQ